MTNGVDGFSLDAAVGFVGAEVGFDEKGGVG